jgi:hypothetical protein
VTSPFAFAARLGFGGATKVGRGETLEACLSAFSTESRTCASGLIARELAGSRTTVLLIGVSDAVGVGATGELSGGVGWREENPVFARCGSPECTDEYIKRRVAPKPTADSISNDRNTIPADASSTCAARCPSAVRAPAASKAFGTPDAGVSDGNGRR